jgi:hypothetical protein
MKPNKSLWLPTAFVLTPLSLAYLYMTWIGISMGLSMPWAMHISLIMSDQNAIEGIFSPLIFSAIMLVGTFVAIKIAKDIRKLNKLFPIMLVLIATLTAIKHAFVPLAEVTLTDILAIWSIVCVVVAWLLQKSTTKKWQQQQNS